jgi:hypothetical protein
VLSNELICVRFQLGISKVMRYRMASKSETRHLNDLLSTSIRSDCIVVQLQVVPDCAIARSASMTIVPIQRCDVNTKLVINVPVHGLGMGYSHPNDISNISSVDLDSSKEIACSRLCQSRMCNMLLDLDVLANSS